MVFHSSRGFQLEAQEVGNRVDKIPHEEVSEEEVED